MVQMEGMSAITPGELVRVMNEEPPHLDGGKTVPVYATTKWWVMDPLFDVAHGVTGIFLEKDGQMLRVLFPQGVGWVHYEWIESTAVTER
jgi:hypothetical protein